MSKIKTIPEAIDKTVEIHNTLLKSITRDLRDCWIINQYDCAKYLTDDEFETLQGLVKKIELLREKHLGDKNEVKKSGQS